MLMEKTFLKCSDGNFVAKKISVVFRCKVSNFFTIRFSQLCTDYMHVSAFIISQFSFFLFYFLLILLQNK